VPSKDGFVGEQMTTLYEALKRFGYRPTFTPDFARLYKQKMYRWYVAATYRGSGNQQFIGSYYNNSRYKHTNYNGRKLVAGPFENRAEAAHRGRELTKRSCLVHADCAKFLALGRACFEERDSERETWQRVQKSYEEEALKNEEPPASRRPALEMD
jgi:hypothetical protein